MDKSRVVSNNAENHVEMFTFAVTYLLESQQGRFSLMQRFNVQPKDLMAVTSAFCHLPGLRTSSHQVRRLYGAAAASSPCFLWGMGHALEFHIIAFLLQPPVHSSIQPKIAFLNDLGTLDIETEDGKKKKESSVHVSNLCWFILG